ncbi:MAG: sugar phosphate isomerase/epimerase family protein [Bryobacteraceae bacterium]
MTRRFFLAAAGVAAADPPLRTGMGIASTSYMTGWKPRDTIEFLDRCHHLGAGGIQASLSSMEAAYLRRLRARLDQNGMYFEVMASLPKNDVAAFEGALQAAKAAGASCVRTACLGGRRYETFATLDEWRAFVAESKKSLRLAVPLAERHRLPLAVENHKDWTAEEFVPLLREYSSEYLGVCLDTGNNLSLLDDPMEVVEALAPYAMSTHVKDMGVSADRDGFLLSEVPFGEGFLDLARMIQTIRGKRPKTRMTLEMITRNPLRIPCLTEKYWATFPERNGRYLARVLRLVSERGAAQLPRIDGLDSQGVLRIEEQNVRRCLDYARTGLRLTP